MPIEPIDEPLNVTTAGGYILLEGECGVAITLTPSAAMKTSDALRHSAVDMLGRASLAQARKQRWE